MNFHIQILGPPGPERTNCVRGSWPNSQVLRTGYLADSGKVRHPFVVEPRFATCGRTASEPLFLKPLAMVSLAFVSARASTSSSGMSKPFSTPCAQALSLNLMGRSPPGETRRSEKKVHRKERPLIRGGPSTYQVFGVHPNANKPISISRTTLSRMFSSRRKAVHSDCSNSESVRKKQGSQSHLIGPWRQEAVVKLNIKEDTSCP